MGFIHAICVLVKSFLVILLWSKCEGRESELDYVTCGSLLKLLNTRHNVRLHSHDVKYGSGKPAAYRPLPNRHWTVLSFSIHGHDLMLFMNIID